ncbi:MAG: hypothetical protein ACREX4_11155 [Gammaproteobacteria bacterium]
MRTLARSNPDIGINFHDVKAFDDEQAKAAAAGTASWRNYLRTCDVAVFLYPTTRSGTRDPAKSKFYTELEVEQAHLTGILAYHLIERGTGGESELVRAVKAVYRNDLGFNPVPVAEGADEASDKEIIVAFRKVLLSSIAHWNDLIRYVTSRRDAIRELISQAGRIVDTTTAIAKTRAESPQEKVVQKYLTECWNLRRHCPKEPELPRDLLRAYFYIVRPCLSHQEIEDTVTGSESDLWNRLASLLVPSNASSVLDTTIPKPSSALFECLSDWRQRALIRFLREVSIGFRYKQKLAEDWAFAKRAFQLYRTRGTSLDPKKEALFDLAISVVSSAAYSLKTDELSSLDPSGSLVTVLTERRIRDANPGAVQALAVYYATLGNISEAKSYLSDAITIFEKAEAKKDNHIHSLVLLACCELGKERTRIFTILDSQPPSWQSTVHPLHSAMASLAGRDPEMKWSDILYHIANPGQPAS